MTAMCVIHPDREGTRVPLFNGKDEVLCSSCARAHGPRPKETPSRVESKGGAG